MGKIRVVNINLRTDRGHLTFTLDVDPFKTVCVVIGLVLLGLAGWYYLHG